MLAALLQMTFYWYFHIFCVMPVGHVITVCLALFAMTQESPPSVVAVFPPLALPPPLPRIRNQRLGLCIAIVCRLQVETMAAEHDVAGEELVTFLRFHHDQGSLLLHGEGAHRLVLLSPQWLVQLFADVITAKRKYYQVGAYH